MVKENLPTINVKIEDIEYIKVQTNLKSESPVIGLQEDRETLLKLYSRLHDESEPKVKYVSMDTVDKESDNNPVNDSKNCIDRMDKPGLSSENSEEKVDIKVGNNQVVRKSAGRLLCSFCSKTFRSPSDLKSHSVKHTGEKEYQCNICFTSFGYVKVLKRHINSHGDLKVQCPKCEKKFPHEDNLKIHIERTHTKTSLFVCTFCSQPFKSKQQMTVHERKHTGDKPFQCENC